MWSRNSWWRKTLKKQIGQRDRCNKQKWISPLGQQTPIHHRRQEHSVQARHGPRGKFLTETAGIRKILLQQNLQNPIEKNSHHRRNETRIGTRWTRDHNQLQRNPHIPQIRDNTWTNNRKDGSTDVKQLIHKTLSSFQRDTGKRDDDMTMSGLQHVTTLGEGHGICSNTRGDFPLSTQRQGHTPNTQPNNDNLKLNHDHEKEEGRTSSKTEEKNEGKYSEMSFDIKPKNVRSLSSVDRFDELFKEIERCKWDALLWCETWRPAEEIWESKSGHIFMGACFNQKHGVRILFNTKMEAKDHKNRMCQRKHQPRRIVLAGVCFHHTGYSDVHIEKMHTCVETWKNILRSSRVVSTPNLLLAKDPKVTTLESTRCENPTSVVLGWSSGWWSKTAWRSTRNSKRGPETEGQSSQEYSMHDACGDSRSKRNSRVHGTSPRTCTKICWTWEQVHKTSMRQWHRTQKNKKTNWVHRGSRKTKGGKRRRAAAHDYTAWQREEQVNRRKKKSSKLSSKKERIWTKKVKAEVKDISKKIKQGFRDNKRTKKHDKVQRILQQFKGIQKIANIKTRKKDFWSRATRTPCDSAEDGKWKFWAREIQYGL